MAEQRVRRWIDLPRAHGKSDGSADVSASTNIQISRQERSEVRTGRNRIGRNVGPELGQSKGRRDHENAKSRSSVRFIQKPAEQIQGIPNRFPVNNR